MNKNLITKMFRGVNLKPFAIIAVLGVVLLMSFSVSYAGEQKRAWVKIVRGELVRDNKPFRFVGSTAANMVFYDDWGLDLGKAIRSAKENNISVLRIYMDWGWAKDEDIDRIIDLASRSGIYLIIALTDCCCSRDYSDLRRYFEVHAPFCNPVNEKSKVAFKERIKKIVNRKNSIDGVIYRDNPYILAWEIANEIEYWHFKSKEIQEWVTELALYVKSLDSNHLVTINIGTDSNEFDQSADLFNVFNVKGIDFLSFHFYPGVNQDNYFTLLSNNDYYQRIAYRVRQLVELRKPVIMEEFGLSNNTDLNNKIKNNTKTVSFYNMVFSKSMDSAFLAGASGVMFWGWGVPEEKEIPMWWSQESHSASDKDFCKFLKEYKIPSK